MLQYHTFTNHSYATINDTNEQDLPLREKNMDGIIHIPNDTSTFLNNIIPTNTCTQSLNCQMHNVSNADIIDVHFTNNSMTHNGSQNVSSTLPFTFSTITLNLSNDTASPPCVNLTATNAQFTLLSDVSLSNLSAVASDNEILPIYVNYISEQLSETCAVCNRILYPSNVKHITAQNNITQTLHINGTTDLCSLCSKACIQNKLPRSAYISNNLDPGIIPMQLRNLWIIEKRLISLIQVFLFIIDVFSSFL